MNRKGISTLAIVGVAVVAFILGIFASGFVSPLDLAPGNNTIRAHACNADDNCQVRMITAAAQDPFNGGQNKVTLDEVKITLQTPVGNNTEFANIFPGAIHFFAPVSDGNQRMAAQISQGQMFVSPTDANKFIIGPNDIQASYLSGNSTAYACLTAEGALYRSNTPCTTSLQS